MEKFKKQIKTNEGGFKEQKIENLADFVRWAVRENAGDYLVLRQQMAMVDQFANSEKNLAQVKEVYKKFFVSDEKVDNLQFTPDKFTIKYEEKKHDCKVAVEASVNQDQNYKSGIVLNLTKKVTSDDGHEEKDSITLLSDQQHLTYEYQCNFDMADAISQTTHSYNNHLREHINYEFGFDKTHHYITHVSHNRQMNENGNWDCNERLPILTNKDLQDNQTETGMTK